MSSSMVFQRMPRLSASLNWTLKNWMGSPWLAGTDQRTITDSSVNRVMFGRDGGIISSLNNANRLLSCVDAVDAMGITYHGGVGVVSPSYPSHFWMRKDLGRLRGQAWTLHRRNRPHLLRPRMTNWCEAWE